MYKALLLCNSVFPDDPAALPRLRGPARDGLLLWAALVDPIWGCFRQENAEVLFEGSRQDMAEATERFFGEASPHDVLLFYYSGHGRRSSNELLLCCRDTVTSRPVTTGLMSDALNKMIERSSARAVIVILDCCYSGAFKGEPTIEDDLAGQGRFVIAATSAYEEAQDASEGGTPSPFTAALVTGLKGAAMRTGDHLTLEDLCAYLEGPGPALKSKPRKKFDGTGSITIARSQSVLEAEALSGPQDGEADALPAVVPAKASEDPTHSNSAWWRSGNLPTGRRVRARNDYSLGDLRSYRFYGILALAIIVFGIVSAASMNSEFTASDGSSGFDGIAPSCVVAVIVATVMSVFILVEWIAARRIIRNASSRRSLLASYSTGTVRLARLMRDSCAIVAAAIVAYGTTRDYENAWYVTLLALLAAPVLVSAVSRLGFGDAAYASGTLLVLGSLFLPISIFGYSMLLGDDGIGLIQLMCGILMAYFWLARFPPGLLLLAALTCAIPAAPELADTGGVPVAPLVVVVGASLSLIAVIVGDGIVLESYDYLPSSGMRLPRLGSDRSKRYENELPHAESYVERETTDR